MEYLVPCYTSKRELANKIQNAVPSPFYATSAVPQGSHLGPPPLLLFVNDNYHGFSMESINGEWSLNLIKHSISAVDFKIFYSIDSHTDVIDLQQLLASLIAL